MTARLLFAVVPTIACQRGLLSERIAVSIAIQASVLHSKGRDMKRILMTASAVAALAVASPVLAQNASKGSQAASQQPSTSNQQQSSTANQNLAAAQQVQQDLQKAGFTDVKVVAESFVVQAKSKDGNPVVMTIGPHGMSVFEAMNADSKDNQSGSSQGTTGSSSSHQGNSK